MDKKVLVWSFRGRDSGHCHDFLVCIILFQDCDWVSLHHLDCFANAPSTIAASMLRQSIFGSLDFFSDQSLKVSHPILGISTNGMFVQHGSSSLLAILHTQSLALVVLVTSNSCDCCCLFVACANLHLCCFLSLCCHITHTFWCNWVVKKSIYTLRRTRWRLKGSVG